MSWEIFRYHKLFAGDEGVVCRPVIEVEIRNGDAITPPILAIIDSGCSTSMINAEYAELLGITVKEGVRLPVGGIGNGTSNGYVHEVVMKVRNSPHEFKAPLNFVYDLPVDILLGQNNFFDHYNVLFEKSGGIFKLEWAGEE